MWTWGELVLLLLKIADQIVGQVGSQKQFQAGVDAEIARAAAVIMRKTAAGKKIMEQVNAMSDADVDAGLRGLEP